MQSHPLQPATQEVFNPDPLLDILTDRYAPAATAEFADKELTSAELQFAILSHCGEEVPLPAINNYMKAKGYLQRANSILEIVWMMKEK